MPDMLALLSIITSTLEYSLPRPVIYGDIRAVINNTSAAICMYISILLRNFSQGVDACIFSYASFQRFNADIFWLSTFCFKRYNNIIPGIKTASNAGHNLTNPIKTMPFCLQVKSFRAARFLCLYK